MNLQHVTAWSIFLLFVLAMLAVDLLVFHRKPRAIQFREAALGSLLPISLAMIFIGVMFWAYSGHFLDLGRLPANLPADFEKFYPDTGYEAALSFFTGYVVELSLSADNIFLFIILMNLFKVAPRLQHRVLFWGVLGALVMRGLMIVLGAALIVRFQWIIYIFGVFLIYTAIRMLFAGEEHGDPSQNFAIRMLRKVIPFYPGYDGPKFFTRRNGIFMGTSLLLVFVCIEFTDLVFALDSIPAIFGITRDPFIVFTSNVFAILGLRSMYFLLAGMMDKFHYLKFGLACVLGFVGIKMVLPALGELVTHFTGQPHAWDIDRYLSLAIIVLALGISIVISLLFPPKSHTPNPLENPDNEPAA